MPSVSRDGDDGLDRFGDLVDRQPEPERDDGRRLRQADVAELPRSHARGEFLRRHSGSDLRPKRAAPLGRVDHAGDLDRLDADAGRRHGEDEPVHDEPRVDAGAEDGDALLLREPVDLTGHRQVAELGIRELLARRDDVEPGSDRFLDLGKDRVEA